MADVVNVKNGRPFISSRKAVGAIQPPSLFGAIVLYGGECILLGYWLILGLTRIILSGPWHFYTRFLARVSRDLFRVR